ncbi:MAG: IS30 family transposase [Lachnospira sp.]
MNKNKHLNLDDRIYIEKSLDNGTSIHQIALHLGKSDSSIAREIQRNRYRMPAKRDELYYCRYRFANCSVMHLCDNDCNRLCCNCLGYCHTDKCKDYIPVECKHIEKAPYCCNGCDKKNRTACVYPRYRYSASSAQQQSDARATECREGISFLQSDIEELDALISPLLLQGQSVRSVYRRYKDVLPCCERTIYNLIDKGVLQARNIDLQRRVRFKARYSHKRTTLEHDYLIGRKYNDFKEFISKNPSTSIVEMDTVIGSTSSKKVLLTLIFRSCHFMIAVLLPDKSQASVLNAVNDLYILFGKEKFKRLFGCILTDRGTEFSNPFMFERDSNGIYRTKLFYCDPYSSSQKGMIERNHEFIRYIIPSGHSFDRFEQEDITLMMNHINNYPRESLNGASPYEVAKVILGADVIRRLHMHKIEADRVILKPFLLRDRKKKK